MLKILQRKQTLIRELLQEPSDNISHKIIRTFLQRGIYASLGQNVLMPLMKEQNLPVLIIGIGQFDLASGLFLLICQGKVKGQVCSRVQLKNRKGYH